VVKTPAEEQNGQLTPDGRWVAYETNESGRSEIVVQGFPDARGKWQVSTNGGVQPRWSADGRELYFLAPDQKLMAASVNSTGATLTAGTPVGLFQTRVPLSGGGANKQQYAVARNGRFLVNQVVTESVTPITLVLNWAATTK
jgi:hypothetical protein